MIMTIPIYPGMVNILHQFILNKAYNENIKFVDDYIMLSRRMIHFQYEIVGL